MSRPTGLRNALLAVLTGALAFMLVTLASQPEVRAAFSADYLTEWFRIGRVMRLAKTRYVDGDKTTFEKLGRAADAGAVSGLDRYTEFLDTAAYAEQNRRAEQLFTGIGILLQQVDGLITVQKVYEGGGAAEAGISPGDRIVAADGKELGDGVSEDDPGARLRGEEGTKVTLRVVRPGVAEPFERVVTRRTVTVPTVGLSRLLPDGVTALIAVDRFERRTAPEIAAAFATLRKNGASRLILDLRENPGGLVDAAVETVGLFTPKGSQVAKLAGRTEDDSESYSTPNEPALSGVPLILLVDGNSASSSEIVAGALQDHGRALLVGARTFGKGIVQSIYRLDDTTGLKLTTAKYTLPKGRSIHGKGVEPDVLCEEASERRIRRFVEDGLVRNAGGEAAFTRRFGYAPAKDEALVLAVSLFDFGRSVAR